MTQATRPTMQENAERQVRAGVYSTVAAADEALRQLLAAGAAGVATGGLPLIVAAGIGIWAGGVLGGFLGAMATRGIEKEAANFYDQAVSGGKLLVAVEEHQSATEPSLAIAEQILTTAGAEPLPLPEG